MTPYERALLGNSHVVDELPPTEEDVSKAQARINWIQSTGTQELIKSLTNDSNVLVADAIKLAVINHQQDNAKLIVHKLIEANTLRKVMDKYVTVR